MGKEMQQKGYDLENSTTMDNAAYDVVCPAIACFDHYMPPNTPSLSSYLCQKDKDGSWCAPKAAEAEKVIADTKDMNQAAFVKEYMNSPILCSDCMSQYESMMNDTEKLLYRTVCPNTEAPTAVSAPTAPAGQSTSGPTTSSS